MSGIRASLHAESTVAGPSRSPVRVTRRSRRIQSEDESSALDSENEAVVPVRAQTATPRQPGRAVNRSRANQLGGRSREVSVAFAHGHPNLATPKARGRLSSRAPSTGGRTKKRIALRPSLIGAQVSELTVDKRAEMLTEVASDCFVRLVKYGTDEQHRNNGWRQAWESLSMIKKSFFAEDAPPFAYSHEMIANMDSATQDTLNHATFQRAVHFTNLATFLYVIQNPDQAGDLVRHMEDDEDDTDFDYFPGLRIPKGKGKGKLPEEQQDRLDRVRRRSAVLLKAWKAFWLVLIPRDKRSNEVALRLWLDLSTQIVMTSQCPTIRPLSGIDQNLPYISERRSDLLFDPEAVNQWGQWELDEVMVDSDAESVTGMENQIVSKKWSKVAGVRKRELEELDWQDLVEFYDYDEFIQDVATLAQAQIAGWTVERIISAQASPAKSMKSEAFSPVTLPRVPQRIARDILSPASRLRPTRSRGSTAEAAPIIEDGRHQPRNQGTEIPLDMAILRSMTSEMDEVYFAEVPDAGIEPQAIPGVDEAVAASPADSEEEWRLKQAEKSGEIATFGCSGEEKHSKFNFVTQQTDAVQVEWESQSPHGHRRPSDIGHSPPPIHVARTSTTPRQAQAAETTDQKGVMTPQSLNITPKTNHITTPQSSTRLQRIIARSAPTPQRASKAWSHDPTSELFGGPASQPAFVVGHAAQDALAMDDDLDEIFPDTQQLAGDAPLSKDVIEEMTDEDDIMPSESELAPLPRGQEFKHISPPTAIAKNAAEVNDIFGLRRTSHVALPDQTAIDGLDVSHMDDYREKPAPATDKTRQIARNRVPTSQRQLPSNRALVHDSSDFAVLDAQEDAEDRHLLEAPQTDRVSVHDAEIASNANQDINVEPILPEQPRARNRQETETWSDPFLVDEDGTPLRQDPTYTIPRDHVARRSHIHGQINGQSSSYSRLIGKVRWTKDQELLLYRCVQKVPLTEDYPNRVVWYLHGEYGILSQELEFFNPQHMKDKMRTIVNTRINNQRAVIGRARFFLPKSHPDKIAFENEQARFKAETLRKLREEVRSQQESEIEGTVGEGEDADDLEDGVDNAGDDDDPNADAGDAEGEDEIEVDTTPKRRKTGAATGPVMGPSSSTKKKRGRPKKDTAEYRPHKKAASPSATKTVTKTRPARPRRSTNPQPSQQVSAHETSEHETSHSPAPISGRTRRSKKIAAVEINQAPPATRSATKGKSQARTRNSRAKHRKSETAEAKPHANTEDAVHDEDMQRRDEHDADDGAATQEAADRVRREIVRRKVLRDSRA